MPCFAAPASSWSCVSQDLSWTESELVWQWRHHDCEQALSASTTAPPWSERPSVLVPRTGSSPSAACSARAAGASRIPLPAVNSPGPNEPDSGHVGIDAVDVTDDSRPRKRRLGFVFLHATHATFQANHYVGARTVAFFALRIPQPGPDGRYRAARRRLLLGLWLQLASLGDANPSQLSGVQRQEDGLGRVLRPGPQSRCVPIPPSRAVSAPFDAKVAARACCAPVGSWRLPTDEV